MERVRDFAEKNKNKVKKTVAPPTVSEQIIQQEVKHEEEEQDLENDNDNFEKYKKLFKDSKVFS